MQRCEPSTGKMKSQIANAMKSISKIISTFGFETNKSKAYAVLLFLSSLRPVGMHGALYGYINAERTKIE